MKHSSSSKSRTAARTDDHAVRALLSFNGVQGATAQDVRIVGSQLHTLAQPHPSREQLTTEAAYHRAEARGFAPGHALEDWLAAEAEVDARLAGEGSAY